MRRPEPWVLLAAGLLTVWGIGSFGLWDPWELAPRASTDASFRFFGMGARSARLPNVLAGLLTIGVAFFVLRGARAGAIAAAALVSTPLFLLNARLAMGDALGMAAQAWVGAAALYATSVDEAPKARAMAYALLAIGITASVSTSGVLLGPLPPLLAVAVVGVITGGRGQDVISKWLFPLVAIAMVFGVVQAVRLDSPNPSPWLGGGAVGGDPPTWDAALQLLFHGFAPWSPALPVAALWTLSANTKSPQARSGQVMLLWLAFGCASCTLFSSRYGTPPFLAVLPAAALVALWLDGVSAEDAPRWPAAVVVALLTVLLVRDYALYPDSPLQVLARGELDVPEVYRPASAWAAAFCIFGATLTLFLVSLGPTPAPDFRRTARWWEREWESGWPTRGWLLLVVSLLGACVVFGLMCFVLDLRIASIVVRAGRAALFAPLVVAALVFGLPWLRYGVSNLGRAGASLVLLAGFGVGVFVTSSFQRSLGQHFSSKPVYESYVELSRSGEPLAVFRASAAAAPYYTRTPVKELGDRNALTSFLLGGGQRWAIVPTDELPAIDSAHNRETGRRLFVADARSARLLLVAAEPVEGRPSQSFIEEVVVERGTELQHSVSASFDDGPELVGFDLALPAGDSVGAGQRFTITWYWNASRRPPAGYEVFVHIDGNGLRLNGDHVPTGGRYPTDFWEAGNLIADAHDLMVPPNFRPGDYTIYVGWFRGSKRLQVMSGPSDGVDRVQAGTLRVR